MADAKDAVVGGETQSVPAAWQWLTSGNFRQQIPAGADASAWRPLYAHPPPPAALREAASSAVSLLESLYARRSYSLLEVEALLKVLREALSD